MTDHEDEEMLKAIFEDAIDGILTIDDRGLIEKVNPAAAKLFGYTKEEITGKNIKILMPEPYHSNHDDYIDNYKSTGIKKIIGIGREVKGRKKDGTIFPFFLSISEVKFAKRRIFTGIIHDISKLRQKERELAESENRLNAIFETVVDGIIIINQKGLIQMINPAVTKLFGYSENELIGNNIKMLMPEPDHSAHDSYLLNYQKTKKPNIIGIGREVLGQRKDGSTFPFNLGVSEVKINTSEIIYTGIIHDLSSQKEIENEIRKLNESLEQKIVLRTEELSTTVNKLLSVNKKLEFEAQERIKVEKALRASEEEIKIALYREKELNELKSRFVSMASHEFRTPLSTILSSAALIGRYTESDQQQKRDKHVNWIKSAVSNLTTILNDFLSISKLEEGKINSNIETFQWQSFCLGVTDELQGLLKTGQQIVVNHKNKDQSLTMDKHFLKNVLLNLLSNAIKYSPENKNIFLESIIEKEMINIEIKDEGMGIPKKDQVHLFDRFFRATNVTNIQGTGLGLNIVKKYIDLMDGEITFKSEEGIGSTFYISLPIKKHL